MILYLILGLGAKVLYINIGRSHNENIIKIQNVKKLTHLHNKHQHMTVNTSRNNQIK